MSVTFGSTGISLATTGDLSAKANLAGTSGGQTLIGGTNAADGLILQSTAGAGNSSSTVKVNVGNNGATNAITVANNGYVGVGISPLAVLHVAATVNGFTGMRVDNRSTANSAGVEIGYDIYNGSNNQARISSFRDSNELRVTNNGGGYSAITFYNGSPLSERMRVDGTGFVGVGATSPNSILHIAGSLAAAYVAKSASYTLSAADYTVECTANTFTVTLPTAIGIPGRMYIVKNTGTGTITIATTASQTIDGSSTQTLAQWGVLRVQSNGANWIMI